MNINDKEIAVKDITKQSSTFLLAFGGYVGGKFIAKQIDGFVQKQVVSGLGANPNSLGMKLIKPVVLLGGSAIINIAVKDKMVKTASVGMGIVGVEESYKALTGKEILLGIDDYSEPSMPALPKIELALPDLDTEEPYDEDVNGLNEFDDENPKDYQDYEDVEGLNEYDYEEMY